MTRAYKYSDAESNEDHSSSSSSSSHTSSDKRCPDGFEYNARLNQCDDVDECAEGTDDCDPEYETCRNTVGDYICEDLQGVVLDGHHEVRVIQIEQCSVEHESIENYGKAFSYLG